VSFVIRSFERADRDQLTELVNAHVAAVLPGVGLSVNTVLSQLEREPLETIVDPWVSERQCLVAISEGALVAAALLHRFRGDDDVREHYRLAGEIHWLVCRRADVEAGTALVDACLATFDRWEVSHRYADGSLPALACYGVPDTWPHIRHLYRQAGFVPSREEIVLVARCAELLSPPLDRVTVRRSLGLSGTRIELIRDDTSLGFIEVGEQRADMARSTSAATWTDIGNLVVNDPSNRDAVIPALLSMAAQWLLLGGVDRLVEYFAADFDPLDFLDLLERCGFNRLVTNQRAWTRTS
jgi:hypothetical protein